VAPAAAVVELLEVAFDAILRGRFPVGHPVTPLEEALARYYAAVSPASTPPRDLIGYGGDPPHPHWPGDARIAVNFVVNYEEGSEYNVHDDGFSEATLTEAGGADSGVKGRDLAAEGMFEYGSRVGFWRVLRIFKERGLPLTVFG